MPFIRFFVLVVLVVLLVGACTVETEQGILESSTSLARADSAVEAINRVFDAGETSGVRTEAGTPVVRTSGISYADNGVLDVWEPPSTDDAPVAVLLHGSSGVRSFYDPIAAALADRGFLVFNASWNVSGQFPDNLAGAACAVRFARANSEELGRGDPNRLILIGHSAGGAAAAVIALGGDEFERNSCVVPGESALPDGLLSLAGGYDPEWDPNDPRRTLGESDSSTYDLVNPISHLGSNGDLHVRLVHGDEDEVIPVESAMNFYQELTAAGYDVILTVLEGAGHNTMVTDVFAEFETSIEEAASLARIESG